MKTNLIARPLTNLSDFSLLRDDFFFPMQETFDRFFQDFFGSDKLLNSTTGKGGYPKMEIGLEGDKWIVRVAVPGVKEEDLLVQVDAQALQHLGNPKLPPRRLRIQGTMSTEHQSPEGSQYVVRELRKSQFSREISLPEELQGDPEAVMKDGILTLTWQSPKIENENRTVKKIPIKRE